MGFTKRGESITDFWPDDTENEFYLVRDASLSYILGVCKEKWPDASLDNIVITSEYIHTSCLTYDSYDSSDYTEFLKITKE